MKNKKRKRKSLFKRLVNWLHLWLGLTSGIIVFIVSITGCLYVFHQEISDWMEPWRFVEVQDKAYVPPSVLLQVAKKEFPHKTPSGLTYGTKHEAAAVGFDQFNKNSQFSVVFMNPYTGAVIKAFTPKEEFDFFHFIEDGHRSLWLPNEIGRPIVGVSILIFVILLITGLLLWWPKKWKKSRLKKSFKITWNANFFRLNYDLHNILGFYAFIFAFILAVTGLVFSFSWVGDSIYYIASGGESESIAHPHSTVPENYKTAFQPITNIDKAWYKVMAQTEAKGGMFINPNLSDKEEPIEILVFNQPGVFYDQNKYFFDQYTLEPLRIEGDRYAQSDFAHKLSMLNYDMHTGAVWGLPGKILAFLISLICASLPVTGFLYWWNRGRPLT